MLKSAGLGVLGAVVVALLVFVLGSKTAVTVAYLAPGVAIAGILSPFVPDSFVYWADPDGGPSAFLLQALFWSVLFWSMVVGMIYHHRRRLGIRPRRSR
jgi:hypothetical protein